MGLHTIQFTWNITIKEPHTITVTRIGHTWTDTLEVVLDGKTVASRTVDTLSAWGLFRGKQELTIDGCLTEIWWKYDSQKADPKSIVLIYDNQIIAQYGDRSAAASLPALDGIDPGNLVPLSEGVQTVNWDPFKTHIDYLAWSSPRKLFYRVMNQLGSPAQPPISLKTAGEIALDSLGREIGFQDEALLNRLVTHSQRLQKWRKRVSVLDGLIYIMLVGFIMLFYVGLSSYVGSDNLVYTWLPTCFLTVSAMSISTRLALRLASRGEAETLCVTTIMYILAELKEEDALIHSDKKQVLLARMSYLARQTMRLSRRYLSKGTSLNNQKWVEKHFNSIELRLRDFERWVYAPMASTLPDLRNHLYQLASIYISGLYGGFTYQPSPEVVEAKEQPKRFGLLRGLAALLPKLLLFLLLIVLPLFLMVSLPTQVAQGQKLFAGFTPVEARSLLLTWLGFGITSVLNINNASEFLSKISEPAQAS